MSRTLAFVVSLVPPALTCAINRYYAGGGTADVLVFAQNVTRFEESPLFAVLPATELITFRGDTVATDVGTAQLLLCSPGPKGRCFYVTAADWASTDLSWDELVGVYGGHPLPLAATAAVLKGVEDAWNVAVSATLEDYDPEGFLEFFGGETEEG